MTPMTKGEADAVWAAIDDQRARTVDVLQQLTEEQWRHPSLCEGWTVRHVAAHLTLQQQRVRDIAAFVARNPRMLRSVTLNRTIRDSAVVQSELLTTDEIIGRIGSMIGSRRYNTFVTPLETLTDSLVHSQDIALPLGLHLEMEPTASAIAATRQWETRGTWMAWVLRPLPLGGYRLTATDADWTRGQGLEVAGPIGALLLLLTGRNVALGRLAGEGAEALRAAPTRTG
jgi:uncharacterized protein (TIGR03083 family)